MSERYAPLTELHERPDSLIYWRLPLPEHSGGEDFALNVPAANRMAQLGALSSVTFRPAPASDPERPVPKEAERGTYRLHDTYKNGEKVPFWRDLDIQVNLNTVTDNLRNKNKLHEPKAWAAQLNRLAVRGIKRAALQNTELNTDDKSMEISELVCTGMGLSMAYNILINLDSLGRIPSISWDHLRAGGVIFAAMEVYSQIKTARENALPFSKNPLHVAPFALDRKAYIRGASHWHNRLIKYRPPKGKAA